MALYVAFEGGEGSGKSTQARLLAKRLDGIATREPGGTTLGASLRNLLLNPNSDAEVGSRAEALLMSADRAQHMVEVVEPALANGTHVVSDRSAYSSLAYQGGARGLGVDEIRQLNDWALGGRWPDLVVLLDMDPESAFGRRSRALDRLEAEGERFHKIVSATYAELVAAEPERFVVVDAARPMNVVAEEVWAIVSTRI